MLNTLYSLLLALMLVTGCTGGSKFAGGLDKSGSKNSDDARRGDDRSDFVSDDDDSGDGTGYEDGRDEDLFRVEGETCVADLSGYGGKVYRLPAGTPRLPADFSTMTPVGQIATPTLNVAPRAWTAGFPGVPDLVEWFAIRFYAALEVPETGDYMFKVNSDDGAKVYINDALMIDNDGTHAPTVKTAGPKHLEKGKRKLVVEWFQGPKKHIALEVFWQPPGGSWEIIPARFLKHPKLCDIDDLGQWN